MNVIDSIQHSLRAVIANIASSAQVARERVRRVETIIDELKDNITRSVDDARRATGIESQGPVIDVGQTPSALGQVVRAVAAAVVVVLALLSLFSFAIFFAELFAALIIATRLLGIRINPAVLENIR